MNRDRPGKYSRERRRGGLIYGSCGPVTIYHRASSVWKMTALAVDVPLVAKSTPCTKRFGCDLLSFSNYTYRLHQ